MVLKVNNSKCLSCGGCVSLCPKEALTLKDMVIVVDKNLCNECATCTLFCPVGALNLTTNL